MTYGAQTLHSYYMFMGAEGLYTPVFRYERRPDCPVCADDAVPRQLTMKGSSTLRELLQLLSGEGGGGLHLKKPSIVAQATTLYMQKPPQLEAALRKNLDLPLLELVESGELLTVTDSALADTVLTLQINLC
jgi:ubiquitin-activating enzyme E1 C